MQTLKVMNSSIVLQRVYDLKIHLVLGMVLLTAIAAHIVIPAGSVPFTLQTLVVLLSGALLGSKKGFYTQLTYLALGAAGLPVFAPSADMTVGFMSVIGPTGGYLLAFPIAAFVVGKIAESGKSYATMMLAFLTGELIILTLGVMYLNTFYVKNFAQSAFIGAGVFVYWTIVKVFLGAGFAHQFLRRKK